MKIKFRAAQLTALALLGCSPTAPTGNTQVQAPVTQASGASTGDDANKKDSEAPTGKGAKSTADAAPAHPHVATPPATATETSTPAAATPAAAAQPAPADSSTVVFRIRAGTGTGAWNDAANPIRVKVGQTLEVHNDDSRGHWFHTNFPFGGPFPHPFDGGIPPGGAKSYKILAPSGAGVHDHSTLGAINMEVGR